MAALSALTTTTVLAAGDWLYVVDGPNSRKIDWAEVLNQMEAQGAAPASFISSGTFADARIAQSNVTQHQAALSITESQISDLGTYAALGANTFTATQNFNGQQVEGMLNKIVAAVTGALTTTAHSGNVLLTTGNVTVPTTAGFNCVLVAGGAHTVTFNGTTSAAMAAGDLMTIVVESPTVIHAVLTPAADKVTFT